MRSLNLYILALGLIFLSNISKSQTLDKIMASYTEAIGGKERISGITSVYLENNVKINGQESTSKTIKIIGKGYKTVSEIMSQKMVECSTDKSGWIINPMTGKEPVDMTGEQFKLSKYNIYGDWLPYCSKEDSKQSL